MKRCVRCKRRASIMVDEPYIAPLCADCLGAKGWAIVVGAEVFDPEGWPEYAGTVIKFDGPSIAVIRDKNGVLIHLPTTLLLTKKPTNKLPRRVRK